MKKIKTLYSHIKSIFSNKIFLYGCIVLFALLLLKSCNNNDEIKFELHKLKQNNSALIDTLKIEKLNNGNLQSSINGYIATEDELKKLNINLYNDVKLQKGKVITLNNTIIKLYQDEDFLKSHIDSLKTALDSTVLENDSTFKFIWTLPYKYDSLNYDIFKGITKIGYYNNNVVFLDTYLTKRETSIDLTFGQKIEDDKLRIFINSPYPGLSTETLTGVLLDPNDNKYIKSLIKKKQWFPGTWNVSAGAMLGYDIKNGGTNILLGGSIGYTIFQW